MTIEVRVFAGLRERFGFERTTAAAPASVGQVWREISGEEALPAHVLAAVNLEYARADTPVREGDEVAFFPPVTGG